MRRIPKVDDLLLSPPLAEALSLTPRWIVLDAVRDELGEMRLALHAAAGPGGIERAEALLERQGILTRILQRIRRASRPALRRVINGTGIIVHTNLGRSLLPEEALALMTEAARHPSNLEFDLVRGERGSRHDHLRPLLCRLTGAEDALAVNNNAAAVLLALDTLARGREAVVSRGELVEIGGSFRIPEVMQRSGAVMVEVGTTNRTHPADYRRAITPATALLLKVHTSNYRVVGFTGSVSLEDLAAIGREHSLPVMEDCGSGCLVDLSPFGLGQETPVSRSVSAGADVVTFSGDKLLGGPQAGLIVGRRDLIQRMAANPLHRALRIDKFTAAALEAVLRLYLEGESAWRRIPTLEMIAIPAGDLRRRGRRWLSRWRRELPEHLTVSLVETRAQVGGGALPLQEIPSAGLAFVSSSRRPHDLEAAFRAGEPPVIGRIQDDRLLLDLRTLRGDDLDLVGRVARGIEP
jgi:L-seryl-tRNA(Ser) seleniumtransferase